jgi:DNA invertase Pin-like site-specific DNA recombinase
MSDKIKSQHLARKAVLYIRQSSAAQVTHNPESPRLQYAMREQLKALGWAEVEVVDEDLGRSAAGTTTRNGFERMVAEVCLGKVGAVAAREVSRFARNSREWQRLVEVCRMVDTLLIDQETIYDPRVSNDRLLLGLKGSLNEYELDLLRQRALEGRNAKVRRGEFLASVPVGFLKTLDGKLEMDPDQRVQEAILLVFRKCLELGSARQVLLWLLEEGLEYPVRQLGPGGWETVWKRPSQASIYRTLTNPIYGGAYAFGRTQKNTTYAEGLPVQQWRRRPRERWLALLPRHHQGYVTWEEFERIQEILHSNAQRSFAAKPGAAKRGAALLAGLLRCRRCGRKMVVDYSGPAVRRVLRYACRRGHLDIGEPKCISFGGIPVDVAVGHELLRALKPAALQAAQRVESEQLRRQDEVLAALERERKAAGYAAERAARQYDATDPANRLVADELERRWNAALERVCQIEERIERRRAARAAAPTVSLADLLDVATDLETVWNHPGTDVRLKKRLVRTLIREIVADIDEAGAQVVLMIHWQGGVHTELRAQRRRRGHCNVTAPDVMDAVRSLARICSDLTIAAVLNRNGLRTGRGNRFTEQRVTSLRNHNRIARHCAERAKAEEWMNLNAAARSLSISARALRLAIQRGEVRGEHPLPDGPWVLHRSELQTQSAQCFLDRLRRYKARGAVPAVGQKTFDFSGT